MFFQKMIENLLNHKSKILQPDSRGQFKNRNFQLHAQQQGII